MSGIAITALLSGGSPMADRVGQQLDNYRLKRLLGAGGFGEVYLAEQLSSSTQVAIKLLPQLAQDDLLSFLNEARTFRLKHPNIVQVIDFGVEGRIPFIVMEYAPNGTLRNRHPKGTRVPLDVVVTYVKQVASALQYAHDQRLIHRDVKPENMLIGAQNQVLLCDFGIATIAHGTSSQSVEMSMAGTIPYMAPEQIQGRPTRASDQYSLGLVVYEWLCGDRPFHGTPTEVAMQHATQPPPPLREKVPTISLDVEQVVMTALAKDPKERFGSVQAFAQALAAASIETKEQWLEQGVAHYNVGRYEAALMAYEQALRLDAGYVAAYYNRGLAYVALKYYDKAIADYNRALQLAPENALVYFNRGTVYHILKQYDRAIADYDQVLRRDPEHAGAYRNRGHAYKELAIADYTQALIRNPNDAVSREELEFLKKRLLSRRVVIMGIGGAVGPFTSRFF
jgi:tetratricopeptide (TPR) repeat protein